ncbi:L-lactate permease [Clostridium sp. ZS2-4]|uniref:L-lactate permease n=1 Tax=Clostridium sp. ZS2-4 TaxID=2987703 RepID=UPI00227D127B|nr:L-lactate permease [Clostridium sp. ZS2-4]MCY6355040.1 L-lactate permease [Clostridium sp. ZS2-4]
MSLGTLALIALIPILAVGILMIKFDLPSTKAMPIGFASAAILAMIFWKMPLKWLGAVAITGAINTVDILFIVYGALLILSIMKKSGGVDGIAHSMATVSTDRRVQVIVIGFLMGAFFEGAAGFGTPAAVAAPLLVGLGFPPLVAAMVALIGNSAPVTFGAVGTPIIGGFASLKSMVEAGGFTGDFGAFLTSVGGFAGIIHLLVGSFIPLAMVCTMTLVVDKSIKKGLEVLPLALFGGLVFTIPEAAIANFVGPEIPSLLGALIAIPIFVTAIKKGLFVPKTKWDFKPHDQWEDDWEGEVTASVAGGENKNVMSAGKAWAPYILVGVLLLLGRLKWIGLTPILKSWSIGWSNILGTSLSRSITPLYNPGIVPFMLVALIIPFMHGLDRKEAAKSWKEVLGQIKPASIALFFALCMTYTLMNAGKAANVDSMLIVMAKTAAGLAGQGWYVVAPIVGMLGSFISGSATVSDIMFGALQFSAAKQIGIPVTPILALQSVGAAAGNMICVHNVVAVLTTVGLVGKEGKIIKNNIKICLAYGIIGGIFAMIIVNVFMKGIF